MQAVESSDISLDDYSEVVALICQDASDDGEQNEALASDENVVISVIVSSIHQLQWNGCLPSHFCCRQFLVGHRLVCKTILLLHVHFPVKFNFSYLI